MDATPYSLEALLVLLNGSLMEWRFRVTSTNNNVNSYEIHGLPLPLGSVNETLPSSYGRKLDIVGIPKEVNEIIDTLNGTNSWSA